ncbi:Mu transposase C-terminal domain-containing protein [Paenibacillus pini]|uniref:Transposase n=1 Tax=Paenibacillus pini JCM 16418 TaxID=1236976 RepID=W7YPX2_9BACL|nr:Mu transposase C-terminal domain-containing protein [Paenibacillus pini]GAF09548.1 transposase [Paenibacillus pini JCM 16418]
MSINQLKLYSEFFLYGKKHKIISIEPPYVRIKRPDGEDIKMKFTEIVSHSTFQPDTSMKVTKKEPAPYDVLAKLSESKREEVSERFEVIHPLILLEEIKSQNLRSIQKFMDQYKYLLKEGEEVTSIQQEVLINRINEMRIVQKKKRVSRSTIMRYIKAYRDQENEQNYRGIEGLISRKGRGYTGRKDTKSLEVCHPQKPEIVLDILHVRIHDELIPIVKSIIENDYLTKYNISKATVWRSVKRECAYKQLKEVSYSTISDIIDRIDKKARERFRNLKQAKAIYDDVARGYADRDALHPLDIIQIDHTRLDMQIIDDQTGLTIDRPWITLGIDVFSRMPWCLYISFEAPSANVVRKAIQHGVFFKNTKSLYGTESEWEAFGIPNVIYVDNGMDFKSSDIKRLVNESLKSEIMHRPVRIPKYGAVIERLFRTVNDELIHNILGTTKSKFADLGEIKPEEEACLTLNQIRKILTIYMTDMYPIRDHRGLPVYSKTPMNRYHDGCNEAGFPEWIEPSEEERYKIEFMLTLRKPYTRDGVRWGNRIYKSEECNDIIGQKETKYVVKYDPDDISHIFLKHPKKERFIELLAVSPAYEQLIGVNSYTYSRVLKIWSEEGERKKKSIPGNEQYARAARKIQDEINNSYFKKKNTRKTVARMTEAGQSVTVTFNGQQQKSVVNRSKEEELFLVAKLAEEKRNEKQ